MAQSVVELMRPLLLAASQADSIGWVRDRMLELGIDTTPVLDDRGRPVGALSLRALVPAADDTPAANQMSRVPVVRTDSNLREAARVLSEQDAALAAVVDPSGVCVGLVSALDLLRSLAGLAFPRRDTPLSATVDWGDEMEVDLEQLRLAPDRPGIWVMLRRADSERRTIVWAESAENVRARLVDLVTLPQTAALARWLGYKHLRVKAAAIADPDERARVLEQIQAQVRG